MQYSMNGYLSEIDSFEHRLGHKRITEIVTTFIYSYSWNLRKSVILQYNMLSTKEN